MLDQADTEAESYKQKQNSAFMTIDENQTEGTELGAEIQSAPTSKHKTDFGKARKNNDSRMSKRSIESNKPKMATKGKASTSKATSKLPRKSTDSGMSVLKRLTNISRKASQFSGNFTIELKTSNNDNFVEEITSTLNKNTQPFLIKLMLLDKAQNNIYEYMIIILTVFMGYRLVESNTKP